MSDSSVLPKSCPQCGAELPADATEGLCPRCLMAEAMQSTGPKVSGGSWQPPTAEELQKLLPQYEIKLLLGRGGMGAVYKGVQKNLDRPVAIKIISNVLDEADASYGERFKNEARAMARLNHPGIVAVHDYGETANGILYIVMEYVEGTDVARMIAQQKRLHTDHAMAITAHVCDALAYAHERGIIHRDIKPANIMVSNEGVVKVADFGLAKMTQSGETGLTQSGMAMGTLHYMAPEALMLGSAVDHRADIYAVGVMLYQMLTGKVPHGMFELPSMQVAGLDPRYDAIIAQAMREDREIRYQSVRGLRGDLDSILTQPVVQVDPEATLAPAAVPPPTESATTQVHRTAGQPYRPPQSQMAMRPPSNKASPLPWVVVVVMSAFAAWFLLGRSKRESAAGGPVVEAAAAGTEPKAGENSSVNEPASSEPVNVKTTVPSSSAPPPPNATTPATASKDNPYVNSLGMKFVPVPITGGPSDGKRVLFSIWETRVQDYEAFAKETKQDWRKPAFEQGPTHPAVYMKPTDAGAFCQWLTQREHQAGGLPSTLHYRLPTDHEWSCAAGLGDREAAEMTPKEKNKKISDLFPWAGAWPPPSGAGNYCGDETNLHESKDGVEPLPGYRDPFAATAPVGSFAANRHGIFDLGGNVWEACADPYERDISDYRGLRGGSFERGTRESLLSSERLRASASFRASDIGFRIVLDAGTNQAAPVSPSAKPAVPEKAKAFPPELATLDKQFLQLQAERVTAVFDADVAKLNSGYLGGLDREMAKERDAGRLDGVLALEEEKKRMQGAGTASSPPANRDLASPAPCPIPATDDTGTHAAVKNLRSIYREAYAKLEAARVVNAKVLTDPLVVHLKTLEADLTKQNRISDAKAVRDYREALPAAESTAAYTAANPFVNSLGMKFVPVPGTEVLFCTHITRRSDYAAYDKATSGVDPSWKTHPKDSKGGPVAQGDDYPVVGVNWNDAMAFCDWLSLKEGRQYRLPTDREWSYAVGIGQQEEGRKNATPESLSEKIKNVFPWGTTWPPPKGAGNFADVSLQATSPTPDANCFRDLDDGYPSTSPVLAFKPNKLGIHDLAGNIGQWCGDWFNSTQTHRVQRGGDYLKGVANRNWMLSSFRIGQKPENRLYSDIGFSGFRCVVVASSLGAGSNEAPKAAATAPATAPQMPAPTPAPAAAPAPPSGPTNSLGMGFKNVLFENSLGMRFAPLPGSKALMCIHETRKGDYTAFAGENPGTDNSWRTVRNQYGTLISTGNDHPVVNVTWDEAMAFCAWLSKKEGRQYRLPTDREWSIGAGLGSKESTLGTPQSRHGKIKDAYPWGSAWPPPAGAGNFADTTMGAQSPDIKVLKGYTDGYATTSPVMSFPPNALGMYDLGGNAWELIDDWYNASKKDHLMRGAAFDFGDREWLNLSARDPWSATGRLNTVGFRCVVDLPATPAAGTPPGGAGVPKP